MQKRVGKVLLKNVLPDVSKWLLQIVVLQKPDRDVYIFGDYRLGVNQNGCSNNYPISKLEVSLHSLKWT